MKVMIFVFVMTGMVPCPASAGGTQVVSSFVAARRNVPTGTGKVPLLPLPQPSSIHFDATVVMMSSIGDTFDDRDDGYYSQSNMFSRQVVDDWMKDQRIDLMEEGVQDNTNNFNYRPEFYESSIIDPPPPPSPRRFESTFSFGEQKQSAPSSTYENYGTTAKEYSSPRENIRRRDNQSWNDQQQQAYRQGKYRRLDGKPSSSGSDRVLGRPEKQQDNNYYDDSQTLSPNTSLGQQESMWNDRQQAYRQGKSQRLDGSRGKLNYYDDSRTRIGGLVSMGEKNQRKQYTEDFRQSSPSRQSGKEVGVRPSPQQGRDQYYGRPPFNQVGDQWLQQQQRGSEPRPPPYSPSTYREGSSIGEKYTETFRQGPSTKRRSQITNRSKGDDSRMEQNRLVQSQDIKQYGSNFRGQDESKVPSFRNEFSQSSQTSDQQYYEPDSQGLEAEQTYSYNNKELTSDSANWRQSDLRVETEDDRQPYQNEDDINDEELLEYFENRLRISDEELVEYFENKMRQRQLQKQNQNSSRGSLSGYNDAGFEREQMDYFPGPNPTPTKPRREQLQSGGNTFDFRSSNDSIEQDVELRARNYYVPPPPLTPRLGDENDDVLGQEPERDWSRNDDSQSYNDLNKRQRQKYEDDELSPDSPSEQPLWQPQRSDSRNQPSSDYESKGMERMQSYAPQIGDGLAADKLLRQYDADNFSTGRSQVGNQQPVPSYSNSRKMQQNSPFVGVDITADEPLRRFESVNSSEGSQQQQERYGAENKYDTNKQESKQQYGSSLPQYRPGQITSWVGNDAKNDTTGGFGGIKRMMNKLMNPYSSPFDQSDPMMGRVESEMARSMDQEQKITKALLADARDLLLADPAIRNLLGDRMELGTPFSRSSSSTMVNGVTKSRLQLGIPVSGSREEASGSIRLLADQDGITKLEVDVSGLIVDVPLYNRGGGRDMIDASVVDR